MWEILNANNFRWGRETYSTREAAEIELKTFWRGVHGVNLKKFTIREVHPPVVGEPVEHRAAPADRERDQSSVRQAVADADVVTAEATDLHPYAIDSGPVVEAPEQYSLGFGHPASITPAGRKLLSKNGQVLSGAGR